LETPGKELRLLFLCGRIWAGWMLLWGTPGIWIPKSFFYLAGKYYIYYMKNRELNRQILIKLAPYLFIATILGLSFLLLHYLG
jgi:hypothetical protein